MASCNYFITNLPGTTKLAEASSFLIAVSFLICQNLSHLLLCLHRPLPCQSQRPPHKDTAAQERTLSDAYGLSRDHLLLLPSNEAQFFGCSPSHPADQHPSPGRNGAVSSTGRKRHAAPRSAHPHAVLPHENAGQTPRPCRLDSHESPNPYIRRLRLPHRSALQAQPGPPRTPAPTPSPMSSRCAGPCPPCRSCQRRRSPARSSTSRASASKGGALPTPLRRFDTEAGRALPASKKGKQSAGRP